MSDPVSRRRFLEAAGLAAVSSVAVIDSAGAQRTQAAPNDEQSPASPSARQPERGALFFFNEDEARFIDAATERLIPADPQWPGASWAGVLHYIDHQLAAAYGAGARMYLDGPWQPDAPPQQGYQLRHTPAELYRIGIAETRRHVRRTRDGEFWDLEPAAMDEILADLESGAIVLPSLPAPVFFETLLANTIEGWFADPGYGGNRDMVSWRMVGFPGAYAQYVDLVDVYDYPYARPPISMTDEIARAHHLNGHQHE